MTLIESLIIIGASLAALTGLSFLRWWRSPEMRYRRRIKNDAKLRESPK